MVQVYGFTKEAMEKAVYLHRRVENELEPMRLARPNWKAPRSANAGFYAKLTGPAASTAAGAGAGTIVAGTYRIFTTYLSTDGEVTAQTVKQLQLTGTTNSISVPSPPSSPGVPRYNVYIDKNINGVWVKQGGPYNIGSTANITSYTTSPAATLKIGYAWTKQDHTTGGNWEDEEDPITGTALVNPAYHTNNIPCQIGTFVLIRPAFSNENSIDTEYKFEYRDPEGWGGPKKVCEDDGNLHDWTFERGRLLAAP